MTHDWECQLAGEAAGGRTHWRGRPRRQTPQCGCCGGSRRSRGQPQRTQSVQGGPPAGRARSCCCRRALRGDLPRSSTGGSPRSQWLGQTCRAGAGHDIRRVNYGHGAAGSRLSTPPGDRSYLPRPAPRPCLCTSPISCPANPATTNSAQGTAAKPAPPRPCSMLQCRWGTWHG